MPDHVDSDTKVYKEIKTQTDTTSLQKDLDNLQEWSDKWLLKFHPNKCKVMTVCHAACMATKLLQRIQDVV
jgi:radical SAM protein with 4Fe4S-binding SPASM domain